MVERGLAMLSGNPSPYYLKDYASDQHAIWDNFVQQSKNGTFLFYRDYMEYHRQRFTDRSLMLYDESNQLIALLPANVRGTLLDSHGGLTYGGFITDENMKTPKMLQAFLALIAYAEQHSFQEIRYKTIPHIYHQSPAEEDLYALYLCGAKVINRSVITAVNNRHPLQFQSRRKRGIKKARNAGVLVGRSDDWAGYWQLLANLLETVHQTEPVHSLAEILQLHNRFPDNIKLYTAHHQDGLLGGIVIYETDIVVRCQYIAANETGKALCVLDLLVEHLLTEVYQHKPFVEFGTSDAVNTPNYLNTGLIDQKEGFGARAVMQDQYLIQVNEANRLALAEATT
jgi:hypothetical protein